MLEVPISSALSTRLFEKMAHLWLLLGLKLWVLILALTLNLSLTLSLLHKRLVVEITKVIRAGKSLCWCGCATVTVRAITVFPSIAADDTA